MVSTADPLARLYCHLLDERFGEGGRVVDKTLDASRYLGAAAAILPKAPIVWVRRAPLDCAWSCFRTFFTTDNAWSWSLSDIAAHFQLEDALLERWSDILGDRLLVLSYEALVMDPQPHISRLLWHCGLTTSAESLSPDQAVNPVQTASAVQARHPITVSAIDTARPYRAFLGGFTEQYRAR